MLIEICLYALSYVCIALFHFLLLDQLLWLLFVYEVKISLAVGLHIKRDGLSEKIVV